MKKLIYILTILGLLFPLGGFAQTKKFPVDTGGTLTTNLVTYYKLEDVNDFWASYNLTNNNSVAFNAGKVNNAADGGSDNTNKYLSIADSLGIDGGVISISDWVNVTTAPASGVAYVMVSQANNTSKVEYYLVYLNNAGTLQVFVDRNAVSVATARASVNYTLTPGTWYHTVLRYDGTTLELFINGVSQATASNSQSGTGPTTTEFRILRHTYTNANYFMGLVDEVQISDVARSAAWIKTSYNSGNDSLVSYGSEEGGRRRIIMISSNDIPKKSVLSLAVDSLLNTTSPFSAFSIL